jgi:hypothetical protein
MTNRPNLTEEEKEHYNKVAMDLINKDIDLELSVSVLTKTLKDVQLERDALWVKTQEDERIINDLNDAVKEKTEQRDEAIRLATLFQALYLRYGKAEDESYSTLLVRKGFESLANLKGLRYFGED